MEASIVLLIYAMNEINRLGPTEFDIATKRSTSAEQGLTRLGITDVAVTLRVAVVDAVTVAMAVGRLRHYDGTFVGILVGNAVSFLVSN